MLRFIPLALVPMALCTLWAGAITWTKGGDGAGWGWTGLGYRLFPHILDQTGKTLIKELDLAVTKYFVDHKWLVEDDEMLVVMSRDSVMSTQMGAKFPKLTVTPELAAYSADNTWDFYTESSKIYFISTRVVGEKKFFLLKSFNIDYVNVLSNVTAAETVLYSGYNPIASSWRNQRGETVMPLLPENAKRSLEAGLHLPLVRIKDVVQISDYRGLDTVDEQGPFHQGDSNFYAYQTFLPLENRSGTKIGYIAVAAPENAVLNGPKYAIIGSSVIFLVLAIIAVWVVSRVSKSYTQPIASVSEGIHDLTQSITKRLPLSPEDSTLYPTGNLPRELAKLNIAFVRLEGLIRTWHELEDELEISRKQLIQSAKLSALGEMAGGIAHEINNPLAVIDSRSRHIRRALLSNPPDIDKALEFAQIIESTSESIAAIVKGLKTFSRSGENDPLTRCNLNDIINDTLVLCAERFRQRGIELKVDKSFEGAEIEARSVQIAQVVLNLLNNAYDAIEALPEKWINLSFQDLGDKLKILIMDSGTGIPADIRDSIMQPFFTTKAVGKGTGLGLSVSKGIIEDHKGTLAIDSTCPNTCFVVLLPKAGTIDHSQRGVA